MDCQQEQGGKMNKRQENKRTMYGGANSTLKENAQIVTGVPALATAQAELENKIAEIDVTNNQILQVVAGKRISKTAARAELTGRVVKIASAAAAFAMTTGNNELLANVGITPSALKNMRDTELIGWSEGFYNTVAPVGEQLADCGITGATLADLRAKIDQFKAATESRETGSAAQKAAHAKLNGLFRETDQLLTNVIDKLVLSLKLDHPDFYNAYQASRVIRDIGISHRPAAEPEAETAANN